MSEKSFHRRSWTSQFGLYRYDDTLKKNKKECSTCFYGIIGTTSIIIITVYIFISNTDFDPPKRLIILSHENKSHHSQQLSTASVFMHQIPTNFQIDNEFSITTPLSVKVFHDQRTQSIEVPEPQPQKLELKFFPNAQSDAVIHPNHNIYPNHRHDVRRRRLEEINQPRPFEYIIRGTPPTAFQRTLKNSSDFPQIPKEFVGTVNSIQDILKQVSDGENNYQESNGLHKIKISGTYKHRKADDLTSMFEPLSRKNRGQNIDEPPIQPLSINADNVIRDPFYKYKPSSLSDVNLMATNQFRFAPAPYNILTNKFVPMSSPSLDPGNLYHQIILANNNRLKYLDEHSKNDNVQSKQKPFTLMLDVYPMPDDEHISSTVPLPLKYKNRFNSHTIRHPGISSINNLQHYFPNANYRQQPANRYPNLPHYHNPNYFRKFGSKQFSLGSFATNDRESGGNNPSQITVHLNLFPKKKEERSHDQNVEILNKNDKVVTPEVDDRPVDSASIQLQDRMAKLADKSNQTGVEKESKNFEKVSNKVDMDMLQSTTVSTVKHNVIVIDDSGDDFDSSEDIFSKEFFQFQTTDSPPQISSRSTTFESKSDEGHQFSLIPTILPIEPRGYDHKVDMSTLTVH